MTLITIVPRKSESRNDDLIQMSPLLYQHLLIKKGADTKISLGRKNIHIKIQTVEMNSNEIIFPENLYNEFHLPIQPINFHAIYKKMEHILFLGPIIGLVTNMKFKENGELDLGTIQTFCEELHYGISETGGFFYVFSYPDFSKKGYYLEEGNWHPAKLPLPDVIYNRIHSRRQEYGDDYKLFRNLLSQLNIPFFNDRFLSKWEVHESLMHEKHLQFHMPETKLFTKKNLKEFVEKYETVFIKPVHGSQGRNIFKIVKEGNLFLLNASLKINSEVKMKKITCDEIYQQMKTLLNNRICIIQQGITLISYQSRGMDFRVLCHKMNKIDWNVTSIVARISAENEFVSNIARGGEVMSPLSALNGNRNIADPKKILAEMREFSINIASAVDLHSSGIIGELGIDIGIDEEGKLWLIEVNSKPSKNFEVGQMKIRPSARAIIQFCTLLAIDSLYEKEE